MFGRYVAYAANVALLFCLWSPANLLAQATAAAKTITVYQDPG